MCDRQQPTEGADSPPKTRRMALAVILALGLAACAAPTAPASVPATPEPTLAPTPSPEIVEVEVEVEVEVVPDACIDALAAAETALVESNAFTVDTLLAYVEYPDENLEEFGGRIEQLVSDFDQDSWSAVIDEYRELAEACQAAGR